MIIPNIYLRRTVHLFLFFLLSNFTFAQSANGVSYKISTSPTHYYFDGFDISIEKAIENRSLGVSISFKPSFCNGCLVLGSNGVLGSYLLQNSWNDNYNSIGIIVYPKYYGKSGQFYFSIQPYLRYWWFTNKMVSYNDMEEYSFSGLRDEQQLRSGIHFIGGKTLRFPISDKTNFLLDLSGGLGIHVSIANFKTQNGIVNNVVYESITEVKHEFSPSIQVKLQLGFELKR